MPQNGEPNKPEGAGGGVALAKTLGPATIIFMGIGCLIGGGIFTLLGPAVAIAGPAMFLAMILGASVAFLNLQMYLALGTTFPEAGGGYLWVRKGLGNFQGFLAGWFSWFAHVAACGTYALSLAFYAYELLKFAGIEQLGLSPHLAQKIIAALVILFFGYLNWRGAKLTGHAGTILGAGLLAILLTFIISGLYRMAAMPAVAAANFSPLMPNGWFGIIAAASFFYIAFEGSEIQVQAGEETKNPAHDLRIGLLVSWAVVSVLYLLVSIVSVGALASPDMPAWKLLGSFGEGAVVRAAQTFMPFGALLMMLAGFIANLAALNATVFSSSHVSFALARDRNLWTPLARIHARNRTPDLATIVSTALIIIVVLFLPLFDVASAASLLFVLLFLQLNLAGIAIHFKFPDIKWQYRVPGFPMTPIVAVVIYALLALTMLRINLTAWAVTLVWLLLGLVNYFAYAQAKGREQFESEIVYEEAVRLGPKRGKRVLVPVRPTMSLDEVRVRAEYALAMASHFGGEIVLVMVHEVPPATPLLGAVNVSHDRHTFEHVKEWFEDYNVRNPEQEHDVSFRNLVMVGRDVTDTILEVVRSVDADLLLISWKGYARAKGAVLTSKIDRILRESACDLLVLKNPRPPKSLMLAVNPKGKNPSLKLMGEIFMAIKKYFSPRTELACVLSSEPPAYLKANVAPVLRALGLRAADFDDIKFLSARSIAAALIDEAETRQADLVLVGTSKRKWLKDIRFGSIPESLAKHLKHATVGIMSSHQGLTVALRDRIRGWLAGK